MHEMKITHYDARKLLYEFPGGNQVDGLPPAANGDLPANAAYNSVGFLILCGDNALDPSVSGKNRVFK